MLGLRRLGFRQLGLGDRGLYSFGFWFWFWFGFGLRLGVRQCVRRSVSGGFPSVGLLDWFGGIERLPRLEGFFWLSVSCLGGRRAFERGYLHHGYLDGRRRVRPRSEFESRCFLDLVDTINEPVFGRQFRIHVVKVANCRLDPAQREGTRIVDDSSFFCLSRRLEQSRTPNVL